VKKACRFGGFAQAIFHTRSDVFACTINVVAGASELSARMVTIAPLPDNA
jgi:hypothetical protein